MHGPAARPRYAPPCSRQPQRAHNTALYQGMPRQPSNPCSASEETSVTSVLLCFFPVARTLVAQDKRSFERNSSSVERCGAGSAWGRGQGRAGRRQQTRARERG